MSPGGADAVFDAVTSTTYKDMAAFLPATTAAANLAQTQFVQAFPTESYSTFVDQGRELRRAVRTEMYRVVAGVGRATATASTR